MAFDAFRFILNRSIIENQGVPRDQSTRLAFIPAIMGGPLAQSVVISTVIGRNNRPPPPPAEEPEEPEPPVELVAVPLLLDELADSAVSRLEELGLGAAIDEVRAEKDKVGRVVEQDPREGLLPVGSVVKLMVGKQHQPTPEVTGPAGQPGRLAPPARGRGSAAGTPVAAAEEGSSGGSTKAKS